MTRFCSVPPQGLMVAGMVVGLMAGMIFGSAGVVADDPDEIPEIGLVDWSLDLESAKRKSEKTGRPVFLLFQEIPG